VTLQLGVLVSGTGSNLQAIIDAIEKGELDAKIRLVLSNRPDAYGLVRAKKAGLPTLALAHNEFSSREKFDEKLVKSLKEAGVQWVALAGFMRVLTPVFLTAFADKIINIHPSLLPAFPGVNAQKQAFDYGVKVTGCTVHFVDQGVDTGPIILQGSVAVKESDSLEDLRARILKKEHQLFVEALSEISRGHVSVLERRVSVLRAT